MNQTVFVVDDDPSVLKSLARLISSAGFAVQTFPSPQEFLNRQTRSIPGCIVLDVEMPGLNGLELQQALNAQGESLPIIFITGHGDIPMTVRAMKAGAIDFLSKPFDDEVFLKAIAQALEKDRLARLEAAQKQAVTARLQKLSPREYQVLLGVVEGKLNKEIAGELGTTEKTIKVHRGRVMRKMGVGSLAELVRLVHEAGLKAAPAKSVSD